MNVNYRVCGFDSSGSGYLPVASSCEYGNEYFDVIKDRTLLNYLRECYLNSKDFFINDIHYMQGLFFIRIASIGGLS